MHTGRFIIDPAQKQSTVLFSRRTEISVLEPRGRESGISGTATILATYGFASDLKHSAGISIVLNL